MRAQSPPAAPLAVVGWWDQRKTQEIFPTSIKPRLYLSSSGPAFHLSQRQPYSSPTLSQALAFCRRTVVCLKPQCWGLPWLLPLGLLYGGTHFPSQPQPLTLPMLSPARSCPCTVAQCTLDLLCAFTPSGPEFKPQVSHLFPIGSCASPLLPSFQSCWACFLMADPGWEDLARWVRAASCFLKICLFGCTGSLLQHMTFIVAWNLLGEAWELLVAACGI